MADALAQAHLRLACNDLPPHKIEHPGAAGLAGFDGDIISEAPVLLFMHEGAGGQAAAQRRAGRGVKLFARSEAALAGIGIVGNPKGRKVATVGGYKP